MKADLALTLSMEGIGLLRRAKDGAGWIQIGSVALDAPDMTSALDELRTKAIDVAGPHFTSLVVIPNDQLLYKTIPASGDDLRSIAQATLDGETPYDVSELAYDISKDAKHPERVHMVAVAHQTLAEAEEFAISNGFNPLAFTAMPPAGAFNGPPYLGLAKGAEAYLKGKRYSPETRAITIGVESLELDPPAKAPLIAPPAKAPKPAKSKTPALVLPPKQMGMIAAGVAVCALLLGVVLLWPRGAETVDVEEAQALIPDSSEQVALAPQPETVSPEGEAEEVDDVASLLPEAPIEEDVSGETTTPVEEGEATPEEVAELEAEPVEEVALTEADLALSTPPLLQTELAVDALEALHVTTLDPALSNSDPTALPAINDLLTDIYPTRVGLPPPAGTTFALDDRGLVIPSAEGSLSPDGTVVFEGAPDVDLVTAQRPDAAAAEALENALDVLSRLRPAARPEGFDELVERSQWNGATLEELARLRPAVRPQSAQQLAEIAALAAAGASLANTGALEELPASELAIDASLRPGRRPADFATTVASAREKGSPTLTAAASSQPPVRISVPSSSSVQDAATQRNVLRLNRLALIGTFGSEATPGAMVRLASGRTRRVAVGDRLDGGRVLAIGEGRVIYRKGARDITLQMPRL